MGLDSLVNIAGMISVGLLVAGGILTGIACYSSGKDTERIRRYLAESRRNESKNAAVECNNGGDYN